MKIGFISCEFLAYWAGSTFSERLEISKVFRVVGY